MSPNVFFVVVNAITVLVNDVKKSSDIDPQEAQQTHEIALKKAEGKRQIIEANLALKRELDVEAINVIS
ncbi:hypothetical protein RHGRI_022450 [Rhododendron griersonianum]|uniref:Uncharacterized protein n=1 Tax=Rhododendron griersonianum TaxID=479676 RepID=A0AAV6J1N5_9ERIC|nr:hypothetical protein RHGRI_022450 [Rhododendron griersonianum]